MLLGSLAAHRCGHRFITSQGRLSQSVRACKPVTEHSAMSEDVLKAVTAIHSSSSKAVIFASGGAAQALSWLLCVPGASATILEASMPYCREAVADVLGKAPATYCDAPVALALAFAAYRRAAALSRFGDRCVGVAATCALATVPEKRGAHRVHVAYHNGRGSGSMSLTLAKGERSRWQEDTLASLLLIRALADATGCSASAPPLPLVQQRGDATAAHEVVQESSHKWLDPLEELVAGHIKCIEYSWKSTAPDDGAGLADIIIPQPPATSLSDDEVDAAKETAAKRDAITAVRRGTAPLSNATGALSDACPSSSEPTGVATGSSSSRDVRLDGATTTASNRSPAISAVLVDAPRKHLVVLPGSFNPLHEGHTRLLATAVEMVNARKAPGETPAQGCFELSIGNPDKGLLPLDEVRRRVDQFRQARLPVLVTAAPRFTDKAPILSGACFVVGYDTAVRLVMSKYHGDTAAGGDETAMLLDFERLRGLGCRFLVAGRLDSASGSFKTLSDVAVPAAMSDLFTAIPAQGCATTSFRMDISSTQIRNKIMGS